MPYSPEQHRLFEAAAHDPSVAARVGIPQGKASEMAAEGVKPGRRAVAQAMREMVHGKKPHGR